MTLLEDKNRKYKRFRPSVSEKIKLANEGLQWVLSSTISAVAIDSDDLIIRFHNGSLYSYPNQSKHYQPMLDASSKGKYFWSKIRRPGLPFSKIGSFSLKSDTNDSDEEIFQEIDNDGKAFDELLGNQKERSSRMFNNNFIDGFIGVALVAGTLNLFDITKTDRSL